MADVDDADKPESGGARAVARKHLAREAARLRDPEYRDKSIAAYKSARNEGSEPADVLDEAIGFLREALRQCADDPGIPPEQKREQIGRLAAQLGKLADPKKIIAELSEELREAHAIIEGLKHHAAQESPSDSERAAGASH